MSYLMGKKLSTSLCNLTGNDDDLVTLCEVTVVSDIIYVKTSDEPCNESSDMYVVVVTEKGLFHTIVLGFCDLVTGE
jgi:hypothetical protein